MSYTQCSISELGKVHEKLLKDPNFCTYLQINPIEEFNSLDILKLQSRLVKWRSLGFLNNRVIPNPRTISDLSQSDVQPVLIWQNTLDTETTPKISVLIPCFNRIDAIESVLNSLKKQGVPKTDFEILIIDDGSQDGTLEFCRSRFSGSKLNLSYFYLPRIQPRSPGDKSFRASLARHFLYERARAEYILFLDSDVIVGPQFLKLTLDALKQGQVCMGRRYDLKPETLLRKTDWENFNLTIDTEDNENQYWTRFNHESFDWMKQDAPWKYLCSHSLGVSKKTYRDAGGFDPHFQQYGFEDTSLGYRLYKLGAHFCKINEPIFHIVGPRERSEYKNSHPKKIKLMKSSGFKFFVDSLDPDVFDQIKFLLAPWVFYLYRLRTTDK